MRLVERGGITNLVLSLYIANKLISCHSPSTSYYSTSMFRSSFMVQVEYRRSRREIIWVWFTVCPPCVMLLFLARSTPRTINNTSIASFQCNSVEMGTKKQSKPGSGQLNKRPRRHRERNRHTEMSRDAF